MPVQVFKHLYFPPDLAPFVNWESIGKQFKAMNCRLEAKMHTDGGLTVVLFWDDDRKAVWEEMK